MKTEDKKEFQVLLATLAEVFTPTRPMSAPLMRIYWETLQDLSIDQVRQAVTTAISQDRQFLPKPGELRALILGDRAEMAWDALCAAVTHVSAYGSPRWQDPVIAHVVRNLGGWEAICAKGGDEFDVWLRKRFIEEYNRVSLRPDLENVHLPGIHERGGNRDIRPKLIPCGYLGTAQPSLEHRRDAIPAIAHLAERRRA